MTIRCHTKPACCAETIVEWVDNADNFSGPDEPGWCIRLYAGGDYLYVNGKFCPMCGKGLMIDHDKPDGM